MRLYGQYLEHGGGTMQATTWATHDPQNVSDVVRSLRELSEKAMEVGSTLENATVWIYDHDSGAVLGSWWFRNGRLADSHGITVCHDRLIIR